MKISKYTFLFDIDQQEFYSYNTLSNALIELDRESFDHLLTARSNKCDVNLGDDAELSATLKQNMIITDNDDDDFLLYKSIISKNRMQDENMHLTLAPTMDCCFRCHYCFEKYKEKNYMTPEIMDSIVSYVRSHDKLKNIKLTWFGGEPLMAVTQIEQFYDKLSAAWKKPISSNIITTGYHINDETIRILKKTGISSMQITLDGMKETHNKIKHLDECDDVFEKVLENIELLTTRMPELHIVIRVNLSKDNAHEYVALHKLIYSRFEGYKQINLAPAFVLDRGISNCSEECPNLFNHKTRSEFILDLFKKYQIDSTYIRYPKRFFNECAIRNNLAISFDPEGYAYKCWEVIGNKEYAIGKLSLDGTITDINSKMLNRQLYGNDPVENQTCSKCCYLPICNGGCPIQRIENQFEGKNNCTCSHFKGFMEEFLKVHVALRKAGLKNS